MWLVDFCMKTEHVWLVSILYDYFLLKYQIVKFLVYCVSGPSYGNQAKI